MLARSVHRLRRNEHSRVRERCKYPPGVEPARTVHTKDFFPIEIARLGLGDRSVPSVRAADCGPDAEASFGKVQAIARSAPDTIVRNPAKQRDIHSALQNKILYQAPHRIVCQSGDDSRAQPKAAA